MARRGNVSDGVPLRITVSKQSAQLLDRIAGMGVYGRNAPDVAARFIDKALETFVAVPRFTVGKDGQVESE